MVLNAIDYTYDKDVSSSKEQHTQDKSDIQFKWVCRRSCETFPEYDTTDWDNWIVVTEGGICEDRTMYPEDLYEFGCFIDDGYNNTGKGKEQLGRNSRLCQIQPVSGIS